MIKVKVLTEALKRNGLMGRNLPIESYQPAIVVGVFSGDRLVSEFTARRIEIQGPCRVMQDDHKLGFIDSTNHGARVWIETEAEVKKIG